MSEQDAEARLLQRIRAGERIESPGEMTEEYRRNVIHLMTMQADSELAGAFGYVPWIMKAPTIEEKRVVAQIVKDEVRHAHVMYGLLEDLGVDVGAHIARHDFTLRLDDAATDIGTRRVADDKRVNIFYYPIDRWADFVFFNFCMDRGAGPPGSRRPSGRLRGTASRKRRRFRDDPTRAYDKDHRVDGMTPSGFRE